jgi:hypothetical protein
LVQGNFCVRFLNICMKHSINIIINQRGWKEVPTTVDSYGLVDMTPALTEISTAFDDGTFARLFRIVNPSELSSVELRPVHTP